MSHLLTFDEAGGRRDDDGLYVDSIPDALVQVFRLGKPVSASMVDDGVAWSAWLTRHHSQSPDYALMYDHYEVKTVPRSR